MEALYIVIALVAGLAIGWLIAGARAQKQAQAAQQQTQAEREQRVAAQTRLEEMTKQLDAQKGLLDEARVQLGDTFKALSADALQANSQAFVERAQQTLQPLHEALKRYEDHLRELEQVRQRAYGSLEEQVRSLAATEQQLQRETSNLVTALRRPEVRGRWGQIALHRVVELAGLTEHCDFSEQVTTSGEAGRLRPDMVVHLPGGRDVVVDSKVPLDAYLDAQAASDDDARRSCISRHCQQIRQHVNALAAKAYWDQFTTTPEFVVMFVPEESFLSAAALTDLTLIEDGMQKRVFLATPITLIAMLSTVAHAWREAKIAASAQEVRDLGRTLYDRMCTFVSHLANVGRRLRSATEAYNDAVGSLLSRVLPSARRFRELGAGTSAEIPELEPIDTRPRELAAPEDDQSVPRPEGRDGGPPAAGLATGPALSDLSAEASAKAEAEGPEQTTPSDSEGQSSESQASKGALP
jgi:DNA recombination protein RmuC